MLFYIKDIPIYFPYAILYPEQHEYITEIIESLLTNGPSLIEMPSGTGKTISLLSASISFMLHTNQRFKILYCSRTVSEVEKTLEELKALIQYIRDEYIKTQTELNFVGVGLTSKKNLCVYGLKTNIEHECNKLIESNGCNFYAETEKIDSIPNGVFTLKELYGLGKEQVFCPYFFVRKVLSMCDCIVFTYNYLIDPRVKSSVLKELSNNCVVIFDEAHNIDNACIEALSVEVKRVDLENARRELKKIEEHLDETRDMNKKVLMDEYQKMKKREMGECDGFIPYKKEIIEMAVSKGEWHSSAREKTTQVKDLEDLGNEDSDRKDFGNFFNLNYEFAPGNIRNSVHFLSALKRITEFFKTKMKTTHLTSEGTNAFCSSINDLTLIDRKTLSFMSTRLGVLIRTLKMLDTDLVSIKKICDFVTLASQYQKGFCIIFEPFDTQAPTVFSPILRLYCLDASIALKSVFNYRNVIITSGTLSPLEIYAKILDFVPVRNREITISLDRNAIGPLIVTKGNDQMMIRSNNEPESTNENMNISSSFNLRNDPAVIRNYGLLVVEFSKIVPDGLVVFFPSYLFMEQIISAWCELSIVDDILKNKLIFIETPDINETDKALANFKMACENGRGGVLFCVARGKVSEGVDFKYEHGRCAIVLGVPYQYTESIRIKKRMDYLFQNHQIKPNDFLVFDAMRQAAQCMGRVLRGKMDYGLMVMADYRFEKSDKKSKLPKWIGNCLEPGNTNLSVDMAVSIAKRFFREMAQVCE